MNPIVRNVLAVIAGIIVGGIVNGVIITISGYIVPLPEGVDPNDIDSINAHMASYSFGNILLPIIAHAIGTLVGGFVAAKLGVSKHKVLAISVGVFFLLGGAYMVYLLPVAPTWMKATDLLLAYIPMGWLGWKLAGSE